MSHFITLVFTKDNGKSVEELLAPYDENIVYVPYVRYTREQAIKQVRKDIEEYKKTIYAEYLANPEAYEHKYETNKKHINYLKNEFPQELTWSDEQCYEYMKQFFENEMVTPNGDLLSTYNPNSKWDWYVIGGRWDKSLKTLSGEEVNEAYVNEIDWTKTTPFAYVTPDGNWHEQGEMGWFACVSNEKDKESWKTEFKEFVKTLDDVIVTVVDCHI